MREESVLAVTPLPDDDVTEVTLRPQTLDDFVGQAKLKERLLISLDAARTLGTSLDHVLLSGPPGLGKTTLASIIANEMGSRFRITSGPALERPGDLASIITNLDEGDVFFIDEIHRLPRSVEEVLYPAMEDFQLDIVLGKGPSAQSIRLDLPRFTLVAATTRKGKVAAPLRDRFGIVDKLDYYQPEELERIVARSSEILDVPVTPEGAKLVAGRSRGTPRIANRLLARIRDYAIARADGIVDEATARVALEVFEVDEIGLDKVDRAILRAVITKFNGGPVGLSTLAIAVGEEPETVEDAYEPFLLQLGFLFANAEGPCGDAGRIRAPRRPAPIWRNSANAARLRSCSAATTTTSFPNLPWRRPRSSRATPPDSSIHARWRTGCLSNSRTCWTRETWSSSIRRRFARPVSLARRTPGEQPNFFFSSLWMSTVGGASSGPARRIRRGTRIRFGDDVVEVETDPVEGAAVVRFSGDGEATAARHGTMPLPPYIHEPLADPNRYQTVYADRVGSAAAPTAGLHFTAVVLDALSQRGITVVSIDLEVGVDTFRPMTAESLDHHVMHSEWVEVPPATAEAVVDARNRGSRVVAIGTTVARTLESAWTGETFRTGRRATDLFIRPGYRFGVVDGLVTNFHVPGSTLVVMIAALLGDRWREVYAEALERGYRFLSFGDACYIERSS